MESLPAERKSYKTLHALSLLNTNMIQIQSHAKYFCLVQVISSDIYEVQIYMHNHTRYGRGICLRFSLGLLWGFRPRQRGRANFPLSLALLR